jgi:hypothetical protein
MAKSNVIDKCTGCLNIRKDKKCDVIMNPEFMWEDGRKCWAYNDSPDVMLLRLKQMLEYNENKGVDQNSLNDIKREISKWEKAK